MKIIEARHFEGTRAWEAVPIAAIAGATVRLHWTDQPYIWHVNDGPEVFVVLDGRVDMQVRIDDIDKTYRLEPGSIFVANEGDAHRAVPVGTARILVVELAGSI